MQQDDPAVAEIESPLPRLRAIPFDEAAGVFRLSPKTFRNHLRADGVVDLGVLQLPTFRLAGRRFVRLLDLQRSVAQLDGLDGDVALPARGEFSPEPAVRRSPGRPRNDRRRA